MNAAEWAEFLSQPEEDGFGKEFQKHGRTGRPLGDDRFISRLEDLTGRTLHKRKPGPKKDDVVDLALDFDRSSAQIIK